ncbi:hypothetical protein PIB30_049450 [Stylosanthes scabra]|uniref:Uncharacterized protein n=1 Tax=Stylosanthes scabra TaxID=79078 RepID=A0ABU6VIX9_9FABA|nr:hypothetical protein [Stylosanthes scabra]
MNLVTMNDEERSSSRKEGRDAAKRGWEERRNRGCDGNVEEGEGCYAKVAEREEALGRQDGGEKRGEQKKRGASVCEVEGRKEGGRTARVMVVRGSGWWLFGKRKTEDGGLCVVTGEPQGRRKGRRELGSRIELIF